MALGKDRYDATDHALNDEWRAGPWLSEAHNRTKEPTVFPSGPILPTVILATVVYPS